MKKVKHRMTAVLLAAAVGFTACPAVSAAESTKQPLLFEYSLNAGDPLSSRMKYIDVVSSGILKKSLGRAVCTGTALVDPAYDCEIVLVLQRSKDGENWVNEKNWSAINPNHTGDSNCLEKSYYMTLGNYYRLSTTANVYSNGKWMETAGKYSNIVRY